MADRLDAMFRFQQQAVALRAQRQEVLAANIANADTPGYKARDMDFAQTLREVTGEGRIARPGNVSLSQTHAGHIPAKANTLPQGHLAYRQPLQPSLDGNTVDMDVERVQFADNTMRYQTGLQLLSGRIRSLSSVMQQ